MIPCHSRRAGKNIMSRAYAAETRALAGSLHTKHSVKKKKKHETSRNSCHRPVHSRGKARAKLEVANRSKLIKQALDSLEYLISRLCSFFEGSTGFALAKLGTVLTRNSVNTRSKKITAIRTVLHLSIAERVRIRKNNVIFSRISRYILRGQ